MFYVLLALSFRAQIEGLLQSLSAGHARVNCTGAEFDRYGSPNLHGLAFAAPDGLQLQLQVLVAWAGVKSLSTQARSPSKLAR